MVRLGVVVDRRWAPALRAAVPQLASGARCGPLWITDRPPAGPLHPGEAEALASTAARLGVAVAHDERTARLDARTGPGPGEERSLPGEERRLHGEAWRLPGEERRLPGEERSLPREERRLPGGSGAVVVASWPARRLSELVAAWTAGGGDPGRLVVEVPVSIGRTRAEAAARDDADWFAAFGDPESQGLFGTLEDCQAQAAAHAGLGIAELRCVLPEHDLPDVVAQLSSVGIGALATHGAHLPPSPHPPAPPGFGAAHRRGS
jgi:hypothetical protein